MNTTCPMMFIPVEPIISNGPNVTINSLPPEDGLWFTRTGQKFKFSEMDQSHLLYSLRMIVRSAGQWRSGTVEQLMAWAKYRGVQFDYDTLMLAQQYKEISYNANYLTTDEIVDTRNVEF